MGIATDIVPGVFPHAAFSFPSPEPAYGTAAAVRLHGRVIFPGHGIRYLKLVPVRLTVYLADSLPQRRQGFIVFDVALVSVQRHFPGVGVDSYHILCRNTKRVFMLSPRE